MIKRFSFLALMIILVMMFASMAMAVVGTQNADCTVNKVPDAITAPAGVTLTTTRLAPVESAPDILKYTTEDNTNTITVAAAGTGITGAKLSITGGLLTDAVLITGDTPTPGGALLLKGAPLELGVDKTITGIKLKLDASTVPLGTSGSWTYTVTYTME